MKDLVDETAVARIAKMKKSNTGNAEKIFVLVCRHFYKGQVYFMLSCEESDRIFNRIIERLNKDKIEKLQQLQVHSEKNAYYPGG